MVTEDLLHECLQDSPKFRAQLADEEGEIEMLEHRLEKVIKACGTMIDSGKTFVNHQTAFTNTLWDLAACFRDSPETASNLNKIYQELNEMVKFLSILLDQASRIVLKNLTNFVKEDIKSVWESKQHFEKISGELDLALSRSCAVPKTKPLEIDQTNGILQATLKCFRHTVLDHVFVVSMLQSRKKHEILGTFLSYLTACNTYFHEGTDLAQSLQPFVKTLELEIEGLRTDSKKLEKKLGDRHDLASTPEAAVLGGRRSVEGYLFKRTSNAFKTWHRRWFSIHEGQLVYRKRTGEDRYTIMEEDLKLCSVRPCVDSERRFCFEVISPNRSHILQADSEEMYSCWISALQQGIGNALQLVLHSSEAQSDKTPLSSAAANLDRSNNNRHRSKIWEQLARIPGNDSCCDCRSPEPRWASINLGVTLCIDCSGVHRSLGVHYSKVRSLTLDAWEPEILKVMAELGNDLVNSIYEANLPTEVIRPSLSSTGSVREAFIKRKWVVREFVSGLSQDSSPLRCKRKWSVRKLRRRAAKSVEGMHPPAAPSKSPPGLALVGEELEDLPRPDSIGLSSGEESTEGEDSSTVSEEDMSKLSPTLLLYKASAAHNLPVMLQALALGADKLWLNSEQNGMGHLHQAVISGSVMACEYLLLNGIPINTQDSSGRTPLHHAVQMGHTAQVCLLLKNRADQHIKDLDGTEALDIAINTAHADIVTLLRLGRLNEEMKDCETGSGGCEDTFNDVVRDFSQLAFCTPGGAAGGGGQGAGAGGGGFLGGDSRAEGGSG